MESTKSKLLATGLLVSIVVLFFQCNRPEPQGSWIKGNSDEKSIR